MYKKVILNGRFWWIILPPILFWLIIFPFKKVEIGNSCGNSETPILYSDTSRPTFTSLVADVLQVPLNLGWYDLHIKYNIVPERGWIMKEPMALAIAFYEPDPLIPAKNLEPIPVNSIPRLGSNSYRIPTDKDIVFHYSGKNNIACRTGATGGKFERDKSVPDKETVELEMGFAVKTGMIKITAETNILAWATKLLILFLLWSGMNLLVLETWKFITKKHDA